MKHKLAVLILLLSVLFSYTGVFAKGTHSDWAAKELQHATDCGILTESDQWNYQKAMKRGELAPILLRAYENVTEREAPESDMRYFLDATKEADALYLLGVMDGVGNGNFAPDTPVTREQIAKILLTLQSVCDDTELSLPSVCYNPFTDFSKVSDWAKPYVEIAYQQGMISGYQDGSFQGQKVVTREEAIVMLVRSLELREVSKNSHQQEQSPAVKPQSNNLPVSSVLSWNVESGWESGEKTITWSRLAPGTEYVLTVTEQRNSRYEGDIAQNGPIEYRYVDQYEHTLYLYPHRTYEITLTAGEKELNTKFYVPKIHTTQMDEVSANLPTSKEEADVLMTEISVPVWRMRQDGSKYASTAELTVHAVIADPILNVFTEIFNGEEQFPIKDVGAYAWRGGRSEHNYGLAVDINANENYCIYKDGTTIGDGWFPYENPYSVTPYGDVVNAFEKYGFTWGGDAWSNPKDYMHFSYLGT